MRIDRSSIKKQNKNSQNEPDLTTHRLGHLVRSRLQEAHASQLQQQLQANAGHEADKSTAVQDLQTQLQQLNTQLEERDG